MVDADSLTVRLRRLRLQDVAFATSVAVIVGAYALMIVGHLRLPLEYDEAFNMTVVENLGERFFYGTNGALGQPIGVPVAFDPYITTGPTLLLPAALVWWLFDGGVWATRLVPASFFALYLVGAWSATRGLLGRWYRLLVLIGPFALVVPMTFEHAAFVPTRLVGETAAATMILWGVLLAERGRLWWGGLLVGLAVQTKYVAAIPAAVVILTMIVVIVSCSRDGATRRCSVWVVGAAVPTLLFELSRLLTLGWDDYRTNVDATFNYSRSVAQVGDKGTSDAMSKMTSLGNMFETHSFLILGSLIFVLVAIASFAVLSPAAPNTEPARRWTMSIVVSNMVLAGGASLLFWLLIVQERSGRHALPGLLLLFPGLALLVGHLVQSIGPGRIARLPIAVGLFIASGFLVTDSVVKSINGLDRESILDEQIRVADLLMESGTPSLDVDGWWQRPEFQILTDLEIETPSVPTDILIFDSIQGAYVLGSGDMRQFTESVLYDEKCLYRIYVSPYYVLCKEKR